MKAAVLEGVKKIAVVKHYKKPEPGDEEVLIKVEACGVCGTDFKLYKGDYSGKLPVILGHEYAGTVEKVGAKVKGIKPGDRVVADPNESCGACNYCRSAQSTFCSDMAAYGVLSDGGFAEYTIANQKGAYKIPGSLKSEIAAFTEPVACAVHCIDRADIKIGQSVAIIGAGPMGQLILQMVKNTGASKIIHIDRHDWKLDTAKKYGADEVINAAKTDVPAKVKELTNGMGADVVIEAIGSVGTFEQSFTLVKRGGRIVLFGFCPEGQEATVVPFNILSQELSIVGAWVNPYTFPRAIELLSSGRVEVGHLITNRLKVEEIEKGIKLMYDRPEGFMKAVIFP